MTLNVREVLHFEPPMTTPSSSRVSSRRKFPVGGELLLLRAEVLCTVTLLTLTFTRGVETRISRLLCLSSSSYTLSSGNAALISRSVQC